MTHTAFGVKIIYGPRDLYTQATDAINKKQMTVSLDAAALSEASEIWFKDRQKIEYLELPIIRMGRGK